MDISIQPCTLDNLHMLHDISCKTFSETFASRNAPDDWQAYLDKAYNMEKLRAELQNEHTEFCFLYYDGALAGYMKLNEAPAQTELHDHEALEIERIYIAQEFQGLGLGGRLIARAIETAQGRKKQYVWLGVWEKNEKAIRFYQRHGFYKIGAHAFFVGDDRQTDYIMRCDL